MGSGNKYQIALILLLISTTALFGVFWWRELFPEYKIYQEAFVNIEQFRSSLTGEPPAPFSFGVKQILMKEGKGPEKVDRCISCHVALEVEDFSPTRVAKDINGEILRDAHGFPIKEKNPHYIFDFLREKIADLKRGGNLEEANRLEALTTSNIEGALQMHPLMGKELRPLQYHPMNDFGCTNCHSGNGRALTMDRAHGPVFDGTYDIEFEGPKPQFLEKDPHHDPKFASIFNDKPGGKLLFQTTPILIGPLMESRCVQCHNVGGEQFEETKGKITRLLQQKETQLDLQKQSFEQAQNAFMTYYQLYEAVKAKGIDAVQKNLEEQVGDDTLPLYSVKRAKGQLSLVQSLPSQDQLLDFLEKALETGLGTPAFTESLLKQLQQGQDLVDLLDKNKQNPEAIGTLFKLMLNIDLTRSILQHVTDTEAGITKAVNDAANLDQMEGEVDQLTSHFKRGRSLYFSQACYACHKIAGVARGGVGPELTQEGNSYPWFIKESIVWPQADLKASTMPNMVLDHEELQDLMTYLLAQKGKRPADSESGRITRLKAWDAGERTEIEQALPAEKIYDLQAGMMTFALDGCASCHRLEGYTSEVGFKTENVKELYMEEQWFRDLIPEDVGSRELVGILKAKREEIDQHILPHVRPPSILEAIEAEDQELLPAFFAPFRFALRENRDEKWQELVKRVMKTYYQVYGLGRLIGPRPNWSGIYRSDEWLMEHFWSPSSHVPRSIMPVFPFDDSKFQQLTYMLGQLGKKNRDHLRGEWELFGFDPNQAYQRTCAQCHGDQMKGNGPVATWIYPIPKNLRSATFLSGLGKEQAIGSILHGVKGTPMPPWGETWPNKGEGFSTPLFTQQEVERIVYWMFDQLPSGAVDQPPPKWEYTPEEVIRELNKEGVRQLRSGFLPSLENQWTEEKLFNVLPGDPYGVNQDRYYIKKEYYTLENIEAGKKLFLLQCAMCHGSDADGSSNRAEVMQEAKPRMLTNLDWIDSRDDLRLLQSITYGVPGTAMTSFADITTIWQRIQLVIYIRSLSEKNLSFKKVREQLYTSTIASDNAITSPTLRKLFDTQRKGVEVLGIAITSLDGAEKLVSLYTEWSSHALPIYSKENIEPPKDQKVLESEMEQLVLFNINRLEKDGVKNEKTLKEWKNVLRNMRETFAENRQLWKDQLEAQKEETRGSS